MIENVMKRAIKMQPERIAFLVAMLNLLKESDLDFDPGVILLIISDIPILILLVITWSLH